MGTRVTRFQQVCHQRLLRCETAGTERRTIPAAISQNRELHIFMDSSDRAFVISNHIVICRHHPCSVRTNNEMLVAVRSSTPPSLPSPSRV